MVGEVDIRLAIPADAEAMVGFFAKEGAADYFELTKAYIKAGFSKDFRRPTFLLALIDDQIVGTASYSEELFTIETWGISMVQVAASMQRQGIGEKLVTACLKYISEAAGKTVTAILNTYPNKTSLYDRLGFTKAGQDHTGGWYMIRKVEMN